MGQKENDDSKNNALGSDKPSEGWEITKVVLYALVIILPIIWLIKDPDFEPLIAIFLGILAFLGHLGHKTSRYIDVFAAILVIISGWILTNSILRSSNPHPTTTPSATATDTPVTEAVEVTREGNTTTMVEAPREEDIATETTTSNETRESSEVKFVYRQGSDSYESHIDNSLETAKGSTVVLSQRQETESVLLREMNDPTQSVVALDSKLFNSLLDENLLLTVDLDNDDDFIPDALQVFEMDDKYFALPQSISVVGMFYRSDLLPEPPKTWDGLIIVGKDLIDERSQEFVPLCFEHSTTLRWLLTVQFGDGSIENLRGARSADTLINELVNIGIAKRDTEISAGSSCSDLLREGSTAMIVGFNWILKAEAQFDFPLATSLPPAPERQNHPRTLASVVGFAVANKDESENAVNLLGKLVSLPSSFWTNSIYLPAKSSLLSEWIRDYPDLTGLANTAEEGTLVFVPDYHLSPEVIEEIDTVLQEASENELSTEEIESLLDPLYDDLFSQQVLDPVNTTPVEPTTPLIEPLPVSPGD